MRPNSYLEKNSTNQRLFIHYKPSHVKGYNIIQQQQSGAGVLDYLKRGYNTVKSVYDNTSSELVATVKNAIPSSDENGRAAYPGENHAMLYLPNTNNYGIANYMGPGTQVIKRLERDDKPRGPSDATAKAHDIRYMLAQNLDDVRAADQKMINKLTQIKAKKQDADFNINQGLYGIKSKVMLEDMNLMAKDKFAKNVKENYNKLTQSEKELLKSNLSKLEQDGNGYTLKPADKLKLQVLKNLSKSDSEMEGSGPVSSMLNKFVFGKENPSFGDVFNSFKKTIVAAYNNFGKTNIVNPGMEGYGIEDLEGGSKQSNYIKRMIAEGKYNKIMDVKNPSKHLRDNMRVGRPRGRQKEYKKKGGSMYLSGGALDIEVKAMHKSVLVLIYQDIFLPVMKSLNIDTTTSKFKIAVPFILKVIKMAVDKGENIQELIKLLSDVFLNIVFKFFKTSNENVENIKQNLKVLLTKYLIEKSKSIVKDDNKGGSMYLAGGNIGGSMNLAGGDILDSIQNMVNSNFGNASVGVTIANTYKAVFTKLISFLPGGDMLNDAVAKFMSIFPKPKNLQKKTIFELWKERPDVSPIWKVVKHKFPEDDEEQIYYIQDVNIMSPTFSVIIYYRDNLPNPSAIDLIKPFLNKNILFNYALEGFPRKQVDKNDIVNPSINPNWKDKLNDMSPKDYTPAINNNSYYNTNVLGKGVNMCKC